MNETGGKAMTSEYDFIVTVEINADSRQEEKDLLKQFKRELYEKFMSGTKISVERIKRC